MNIVDATTEIVDFLRGTIPTPHAAGVNWIYADYPRYDATFPRISVTQVSGSLSEVAIGSQLGSDTGRMCSLDYDIDVWVKMENKVTIGATTYTGTKLRDKYAQLIISELQAARQTFKTTHGFLDIEITNIISIPLDEEHDLHRKTITIRITFFMVDA